MKKIETMLDKEFKKYPFLAEPIPVMEQEWDNSVDPIVSISCITYNHKDFIKEAIGGFLKQETTFQIEVLINDDCSNDGTSEIIKEYELKYPNLIKPIYQEVNQYSQGVRGMSRRFNYPRAKGKYIALCEGDDFWTDPLKLQKQVDFLEKHSDCSLCFHNTKMTFMDASRPPLVWGPPGLMKKESHLFTPEEAIAGGLGIWTSSMIMRSSIMKERRPDWLSKVVYGDVAVRLICANEGNFGFIGGKPMSVYRRGVPGAWSADEGKTREWEEQRLRSHFQVLDYFNEYSEFKYSKAVEKQKKNLLRTYLLRIQDFTGKMEAAKILLRHLGSLGQITKRSTAVIWVRFFLGKKGYDSLKSTVR